MISSDIIQRNHCLQPWEGCSHPSWRDSLGMQRSGLSCTFCLHTRTWDKKAKAETRGALIFASDITHRKLFLQFLRGCCSRPAGRDPLEDAVLWTFFCTHGFTPGHEIRPQKLRSERRFRHHTQKALFARLFEGCSCPAWRDKLWRMQSCFLHAWLYTRKMRLEGKSWDRIRVTAIFDSDSRRRWADHV